MKIALAGNRLESVEFDYTVALTFSDGWEVRIETPFALHTSAGVVPLDPGTDAERGGPLLTTLIGRSAEEAEVTASGALSLGFGGGTVVTVQPDRDYESWTVAGPAGEKLVCRPGGEISTWPAARDDPAL